ncbi:hypothetical protein BDW42DRAFT_176350, partial [Aspergillus taichungensis]
MDSINVRSFFFPLGRTTNLLVVIGYLAVLHGRRAKQTRISAARTCIWTTPSSPPTPGN